MPSRVRVRGERGQRWEGGWEGGEACCGQCVCACVLLSALMRGQVFHFAEGRKKREVDIDGLGTKGGAETAPRKGA